MATTTKRDELCASAKQAIDAIVHNSEIDDDTREEVLEEIEEHIADNLRMLSGEDEEEDDGGEDDGGEDEEDDIDFDDDEDDDD